MIKVTADDFAGLGVSLQRPMTWDGEFQLFDDEFIANWGKYMPLKPREFIALLERDLPTGTTLAMDIDLSSSGNCLLDGKIMRHGREIGMFNRSIHVVKGGQASNNKFVLSGDVQGQGIGRQLSVNFMDLYQKMQLQRIYLTAGKTMCGYVWARMGFVPDVQDWFSLRLTLSQRWDKLRAKVSPATATIVDRLMTGTDPRTLWALADLTERMPGKDGRKLSVELLAGTEWTGRLYLNDQEQMARFKAATAQPQTPSITAAPARKPKL